MAEGDIGAVIPARYFAHEALRMARQATLYTKGNKALSRACYKRHCHGRLLGSQAEDKAAGQSSRMARARSDADEQCKPTSMGYLLPGDCAGPMRIITPALDDGECTGGGAPP
ncbi:hypothetical protein RRF57_006237 [Xylaria bambusicola]|uniref:Uncharacterized protein n=1 Tax=Xylaria bambusicola TaxID=326684 RepID=A0AAN7UKV8_9PEZI